MRIWAHRGCSQRYPENTLLAFEKAAALSGLTGIELDIQLTKDGELVVIHDERVDRTTEGIGFVRDYSLSRLKKLHIYAGDHPAQSIPTMEEVFDLLESRLKSGLKLNIELKNSVYPYENMEEKITAMVHRRGLQNAVVYSSFYAKSLAKLKAIDAEASIGILDGKVSDCLYKLLGGCGAAALHPFFRGIDLPAGELEGYTVRAWMSGHLYPEKPTGTRLDLESLKARGITDIIINEPEVYTENEKNIGGGYNPNLEHHCFCNCNYGQEQPEDWIDYTAAQIPENYKGRRIVIWGSFAVSDLISKKLKEKYKIDTAFYVDSDQMKMDGRQVFSPDYLAGKSDRYYVIVPLSFYKKVKEQLIDWGYQPGKDYYYFCDCALRQEPEYYEDAHGNKIIGNYQGLKFTFSGFNSVIEIGDDVKFQDTSIYLHNNSKIKIENHVKLCKNKMELHNLSEAAFGKSVDLQESIAVLKEHASLEIKSKCKMVQLEIIMEDASRMEVGNSSIFGGPGVCSLGKNAVLESGRNFDIVNHYWIAASADTSVIIGDDCMFSNNIHIRSNDGHSIFDIASGKNINSTSDICKNRKVIIGNHVWVGERAQILYHTKIGAGSIIGAMSLVKGEIPNNCIAAGIPAKVIRKNVAWSRKLGAEQITECGQEYIHKTETAE